MRNIANQKIKSLVDQDEEEISRRPTDTVRYQFYSRCSVKPLNSLREEINDLIYAFMF